MIRVAQIGVGYWGPNLLRNLAASNRCEVAAVADLSAERRALAQKICATAHVFPSPEPILENPSIQAIVIATPAATHFSLALRALQSGKHILVEKPIAMSAEEVDALEAAAGAGRLVAMSGHTFLFHPAILELKKILDSGELGDIRYISTQRLNLGRIRSDVDALWNLAPHDISIIQFLLDNISPTAIHRYGMDFLQPGIEDVSFLILTYPAKILAHIHVSWLDPRKVRCVTVVGSKKMAVCDDVAENKLAIYDKAIEPRAILGEKMDYDTGPVPLSFVHRSGEIRLPAIPWVEPLKAEIEHFLDCIEKGIPCRAGLPHSREVVRILEVAGRTPNVHSPCPR